VTIEIIFKNF